MNDTQIIPAPSIIPAVTSSRSQWDDEYAAFVRLKPELLRQYYNQYVAVSDGQVVESGNDQIQIALRAYAKCGYKPIFVGLVSDEQPVAVRIPSPRSAGPQIA